MNVNSNDLTIDELKHIDLVDYLASLGYQPAKIKGNDFWYSSPLRQERTPSFKINRTLNRWYDFGLGQGGNFIDFALAHQGCTLGELLSGLKKHNQNLPRPQVATSPPPSNPSNIVILEQKPLRADALIRYLQDRRIAWSVADQYCKEIHYRIGDQNYFAIGFPNKSGGFELRNRFSKISSSPKDISLLTGNNSEVLVFEGFMDFLSFRTLHSQPGESQQDFLILNSVSLFARAQELLIPYKRVGLYLDQDEAGRNLTRKALAIDAKYVDQSGLYAKYKDLNQWMTAQGEHPHTNIQGTLQAINTQKRKR